MHVEEVHQGLDPFRECVWPHPVEATKVLDVLDSGQAWVQAEGVRKNADAPADLLGLRDGVQPVDGHGSTVGAYESVEHADGRGLARAVGPEEAGDFAVSRIEADVLDRDDVAEPLVEIPARIIVRDLRGR